jgi:mannose-6-phosphate isomerase-like protein (cupin superfamily)
MRPLFLPFFASLFVASNVLAQTAPARGSAPKPTTFKAAVMTVQVSDTVGAPLSGTTVTATGPVSREGQTSPDGTIQLLNLRAGTYRLRFEREGSITLEREVTVRAGESATVDVALAAAPPPPKAPEPVAPSPPTATLGAPGDPKTTPVPLFLEKNFIGGREARKESALGCAATGTGTLHQLRDTWTAHTHDDADEWLYVVAGEGVLRLPGSEQRLQAGTFSLVPHTISHTLVPQGRNPLIVISVLSGPACKG